MKSNGLMNMTEGTPWKLILVFSLPMLLGNFLQQMYNVIDSVIVGQYVGPTALAAVGTAFPVIFLLISMFIGFGVGATIIISQYYGAGNREGVQKTIDTIYVTLFAFAIPLTLIGVFLARPLLIMMNTPSDVLDQATIFMQITFVGTIGMFGYNVNAGILQGLGDSKSPLIYLGMSTFMNISLVILFVAGFKWGVAGAATATIISQMFAFIFGIWHINRKQDYIRISFRKLKFDKAIFKDCVKLGLPAGLQNVTFSLGIMVLQGLINSYQMIFMAGFNAASKIDAIAFMPMMTFSSAITTYVGQNIGAGRMDRVKKGLNATLALSSLFCVIICPLILLLAGPLLTMFTDDVGVIQAGMAYLFRVVPFYLILSVMFVITGALRGAGESMIPLISAVISLWLARLPLAYLLAGTGRDNLFYSWPLGWLVGLVIVVAYYMTGRWKNKSRDRMMSPEIAGEIENALL